MTFLEAFFKGRCRSVIMADKNMVNLEIHLLGHPQSVGRSKTEGTQCNSINSNKNQVISVMVSEKD